MMIVAGEASGDLHGSNLVRAVRELSPDISFFGMGGELMKEAGADILLDSSEIAVVGISEVVSKLRKILEALNLLKKKIKAERPSLLVLIDFPDFNLKIAECAKKAGIPVLYYISPQVWAWRKGRVNKIAGIVDRMAVVFPFEVEIYKKAGLDARFVGHPLIDAVKIDDSATEIRKGIGADKGEKIIGLLPGSREKEIKSLLPAMLESAEIMASRSPEFRFVLPLAHTVKRDLIDEYLPLYNVKVTVVSGRTYEVLSICDMAFIASGTATLEAAVIGTPMVVVYKISALSYILGRLLVKLPYVSLPNIVAGREIIPELLQDDANPGRMVEEAFAILFGKGKSEEMKRALQEVREKLGGGGASKRAAQLVTEMVEAANCRESAARK